MNVDEVNLTFKELKKVEKFCLREGDIVVKETTDRKEAKEWISQKGKFNLIVHLGDKKIVPVFWSIKDLVLKKDDVTYYF